MSKAHLVITAVVLEGRSKNEVAGDYDVSRYWVQQLVVHRYPAEGAAVFESHSRRPTTIAMIDRLVHHAEVIALKDDSYRIKDRDLGRVPTVTADDQ